MSLVEPDAEDYFVLVAEATSFHLLLVSELLSLGVAVRKNNLGFVLVAEPSRFHSRAVEFCKSACTTLGFFGTLCIRPATKSEISARALTREETASL